MGGVCGQVCGWQVQEKDQRLSVVALRPLPSQQSAHPACQAPPSASLPFHPPARSRTWVRCRRRRSRSTAAGAPRWGLAGERGGGTSPFRYPLLCALQHPCSPFPYSAPTLAAPPPPHPTPNPPPKDLHRDPSRVQGELGAYAHVNRKALDQYANFTEQREELRRRREEVLTGGAHGGVGVGAGAPLGWGAVVGHGQGFTASHAPPPPHFNRPYPPTHTHTTTTTTKQSPRSAS